MKRQTCWPAELCRWVCMFSLDPLLRFFWGSEFFLGHFPPPSFLPHPTQLLWLKGLVLFSDVIATALVVEPISLEGGWGPQ